MMRLIYILFFVGTFLGREVKAQLSYTHKAYKSYQADRNEEARAYSDTSITTSSELNDPQTWKIRGFVYYESFSKKDIDAESRSSFRNISEEAFKKVLELDTSGIHSPKAKQGLYNIAAKYNNDVVKSLNDKEYHTVRESFEKYKELTAIAKPEVDLKQKEIDFNNSLGFLLSSIYNNDKEGKKELWQESLNAYASSLVIDSLDIDANYAIGILYYNKGVNLLLSIPTDAPMSTIFDVQEKTMYLFLKSRPFMINAYHLDPTNGTVLDGLEGIDYQLNDQEKVDQWRELKKELKGN